MRQGSSPARRSSPGTCIGRDDRLPAQARDRTVMTGVCLLAAGMVVATIPADEFTLAWQHSVEKTRWEERYRVSGDRLALVEARVAGMGAGMEPPPGAHFANGHWSWR